MPGFMDPIPPREINRLNLPVPGDIYDRGCRAGSPRRTFAPGVFFGRFRRFLMQEEALCFVFSRGLRFCGQRDSRILVNFMEG
jgi:hypothetical protein